MQHVRFLMCSADQRVVRQLEARSSIDLDYKHRAAVNVMLLTFSSVNSCMLRGSSIAE
jgi:hypothetical protein